MPSSRLEDWTPAAKPAQSHEASRELKGPLGHRALRLGRLFGIEIGVDATWIIIFVLITLSLAQGYAAAQKPWTPLASWGAGLLTSVLFFSSIVLHELGHSLTSQALGLPVRSITLFVFGGVASLSGEPQRPRDEFLIAAAGPLVSVLLGLLFLLVSAAMPGGEAAPSLLGTVFGWLGVTNLILAGFNLVPGFPLDGGRLMRALVWRITGDFERATYVASGIGSVFAYTLIGIGIGIVSALMFGAVANGLWFAFIGWFLLSAAQSSATQVTLQRQLGALSLSSAAGPPEPVMDAEATVTEALEELVLGRGSRFFFVERAGQPVGLVTLHQLKEVPAGERGSTPVAAVMLAGEALISIPEEASLWQAFERMSQASINQIVVVTKGQIVGVLTRERVVGIVNNLRAFGSGR